MSRASAADGCDGSSQAMTIALYAEFTARPDCVAEVGSMLAGFATVVRAEPGNLEFRIHRHARMPERFFVYEVYADREAFDAHVAADRSRVFNDALGLLIAEPASVLTMLLTD